jgi:CDP-glucose 4,6-dehydratase
VLVNVTTDKCYLNREWCWGYREDEPLGGHDPYSSSKACSELVSAAFRSSFFHPHSAIRHATARAGNVIGGGDWAQDRLVPDILDALIHGRTPLIRSPHSIRPWQHVLDPLHGYLLLAETLWDHPESAEAWNFGPYETSAQTVGYITNYLSRAWGFDQPFEQSPGHHPHEANYLKLDSSKAHSRLGWRPRFDLHATLDLIIHWYKGLQQNQDPRMLTLHDISTFETDQEPMQ